MYIAAQVFIVLSSILYGISVFAKNKKVLLVIQILSSCFYWANCFFLKAWVGGIVALLDTTRIIIFYLIEKFNGTQNQKIITGVVLLIVGIVASIFTWGGWYSIFPLLGTVVFVISLAISNLMFIKFATIFGSITATIYLGLIGSPIGAVMQSLTAVMGMIGLIIDVVKNRKKAGDLTG